MACGGEQGAKASKKGINSLVILVAWCICKARNACIFDEASPRVPDVVQNIKDEAEIWCWAGAKGLAAIWSG